MGGKRETWLRERELEKSPCIDFEIIGVDLVRQTVKVLMLVRNLLL